MYTFSFLFGFFRKSNSEQYFIAFVPFVSYLFPCHVNPPLNYEGLVTTIPVYEIQEIKKTDVLPVRKSAIIKKCF